ncbi:MAG: hypothetical protein Q4G24_05650 [Paracoccus sp. (in: a-proteobacteria)]|uniref:hypothetical protein n=1 Tax=Paracoccus sp. TaxID=267 RepID=UPI0026DF7CB8|nr:hypothetical protein [Paracoccus sp. (in: a-proteobacteria)]MDO5620938.1 hypothetical protein [Paracoccus sp. (in: a-proteobacteria)]
MSTLYSYYAYAGPTPPDAPEVMARVEAIMRAQGLIEGEAVPSASPGERDGPAFRPGPGVDAYYPDRPSIRGSLHYPMIFHVGPVLSMGQLHDPGDWRCPHCGWLPCDDAARDRDEEQADAMHSLIGNAAYQANFAPDATVCPNCDRAVAVNDWCAPYGPDGDHGFLVAGCGIEAEGWTRSPEMVGAIAGILKEAAPGRRVVIDAYRL